MSSSYVPNLGVNLDVYFSICLVLCFFVVGLRVWARVITKGVGLWWDDWLSIIALAFMTIYFALFIAQVQAGLGVPSVDLEPLQIRQVLLLVYVNSISSFFCTVLPKMIALLFYARIFPAGSLPRGWLWTGHVLSLAWLIYNTLVLLFQCHPIHKAWEPMVDGHCISMDAWYIAAAATDFAIDLYVLLLPMPILFRLHMSKSRRFLLAGLFVVGYLSAALSLTRLCLQASIADKLLVDLSYSAIPNWYVVYSEPAWSLIGVCLPAIFYLYRHSQEHGLASLISLNSLSRTDNNVRTDSTYARQTTKLATKSLMEHTMVGSVEGSKDATREVKALTTLPDGSSTLKSPPSV